MTAQSAPSWTWGRKRVYSVLAKPAGKRSGAKLCSTLFPARESPEAALAEVLRMATASATFRTAWQGWQFVVVDLSEMVEITAAGVVQRYLNETRVEKKGGR